MESRRATPRRKRGRRAATTNPSATPTAATSSSHGVWRPSCSRPPVGGGAGRAHELGRQDFRWRCTPGWVGSHGQAWPGLARRRGGARTDYFVGPSVIHSVPLRTLEREYSRVGLRVPPALGVSGSWTVGMEPRCVLYRVHRVQPGRDCGRRAERAPRSGTVN